MSTGRAVLDWPWCRAQTVSLRPQGAWAAPRLSAGTTHPGGRASFLFTGISTRFLTVLGPWLFIGHYIRGPRGRLTDFSWLSQPGQLVVESIPPKQEKGKVFFIEILGSFITKGRRMDVGRLKIHALKLESKDIWSFVNGLQRVLKILETVRQKI